jgi:hypothetical protein
VKWEWEGTNVTPPARRRLVLAKIDEYMKLLDVHRKTETQEANDAVSDLLPVMEQIAAAVEPGRSHQWWSPYPV